MNTLLKAAVALVVYLQLVLIGFSATAHAFPSLALSGSAVECAGGWNKNFLYLRNKDGTKSWLEPADAGRLVGAAEKIIKDKIRRTKSQIKRASKRNKARLKKKLKQQSLFLRKNTAIGLAVRSCLEGKIVGASPATTTGTGLITSSTYAFLGGGLIYASDGQFLGVFSSISLSNDSINNRFGAYGSSFSSTSMFNQFSRYGGIFSTHSPFNQFSVSAPIVYIAAQPAAYISSNQFIYGARIDPSELFAFLGRASDIP